MIVNTRDLAKAYAVISMLKSRCDLLSRRIANPSEAAHAISEITRMRKRVDELSDELRHYWTLIARTNSGTVSPSLIDIPASLIERRIRVGWSQIKLSQAIGSPRQTVAKYERTRYVSVSLKKLIQIDLILRAEEARLQDYPPEKHR